MRLIADIRFALRQFRKAPVFTITILAVLALGVGATTAIFGLFDQVLLRSLPVTRPQELVRLQGHSDYFNGSLQMIGGSQDEYASYPAYRYLRDNTGRIFSGLLASSPEHSVGIQWQGETRLAIAELVSGNYFQVLGVNAAAGRTIQPSDDTVKMGSPVAMLSYGYWQSRFGGDPRVIGAAVRVNGHLFTIVGVTSQRFHSVSTGEGSEIYVPMMTKPAITPDRDDLNDYTAAWLNMVARLAPGVTLAQATAAMQPIWHAERILDFSYQTSQTAAVHKRFVDQAHMKLLSGATGFSPLRDTLDTPMKALLGMAGLVLLMACANVAGLLLVRSAGRVREMSVRYALGAKRYRIVQQLLGEGILLGLAGGGLGLLIARPVSELLARRLMVGSVGEAPFSTTLDLRLLLIALGITLGTSVLFSLAPALQFWRPNLAPALKQQNVTVSGGALLLRRFAVGAQIALSVLLLAAAGLFLRTVNNLRAADLGFRPDHLVEFDLDPRLAGYRTDQVNALDARILATLQAMPGASSVSAGDDPEMADSGSVETLEIPGFKPAKGGEMNVEWSGVMPNYLETLGVPLIAGRNITENDRHGAAPVAVINRSAAVHFYGGVEKAIGRTLKGDNEPRTIIGVAEDFHHGDATQRPGRRVFVPYLQEKPHQLTFYVRTAAAPGPMLETIRQAMHRLDPSLALDSVWTMDTQIDMGMSQARTLALLASAFGILAALMSAVGLYGVLAFDTLQRTREIGVRMALGASREAVARLLLLETVRLASISILVGLPMAWEFARLAKSLLFGVQSADPLTYAVVALLVGLVAVAASSIPTWRATSIEPMEALRYE
ncbi:MAG TPA: ABC transporter permease [Acidobacteriaceae bacterium]